MFSGGSTSGGGRRIAFFVSLWVGTELLKHPCKAHQ
jgi:hypothetical protein